ncbi:MAG: peptide deformylase [bacterium]
MLKILTYPNQVLRECAEPVEIIDDDIRKLIDDMIDAMYDDDGVGLAATQVGVSKRIIVLDAGSGPMGIINPEIVQSGGEEQTAEEGCLSFPGIRFDVMRPSRVVMRGLDEEGSCIEMEAEGLIARVFLHEIDHLNGILFIDHASSLQRRLLRAKLRKLEKIA